MTKNWLSAGWPIVRIRDIGRLHGGGTPSRKRPEYFQGTIPWITGQDIPESHVATISNARDYITDEAIKESATRVVPAGAVIVTTRVSVGKTAVAGCPICFSQDVTAILIHSAAIALPAYVAHFLRSRRESLLQKNQGSTISGITRDSLALEQIPLPPLSEQQRIVEILQEAEEIRRLRAEAEAKTAELIPSLFFSHFKRELSTPNSHSHRLAGFCLNDTDVKCGPFGTQLRQDEFTRGGIPLWGIQHVNDNFKTKTDEFVSAEKAKELEPYSLGPGDIVMTRKGTIGNCAIYPDCLPKGIMHSDLLRIRIDLSRFNPIFLATQLALSPVVEKQISSQSVGAVMPGINVTRLKELKLFVVDRQRQDLFASEVHEVIALQSLAHRSHSDERHLLASLSAHAFSGKLTSQWREAHQDRLAIEAQARDAALKEAGAKISRRPRVFVETIEEFIKAEDLIQVSTDGIYAELNREQQALIREIGRMVGGVRYARYFTAQQLSDYLSDGPLRRNPRVIEEHLAVLAARGIIIPVSREEQTEETGRFVFGNAYRLPLPDIENVLATQADDVLVTQDGKELLADTVIGDDARIRELERLAAQLEKERSLK